MVDEWRKRERNQEVERRERLRYEVLERLYVLAGEGSETAVGTAATELSLEEQGFASMVHDLELLGYLERTERGARCRLTPRGIEYLQRGAWRRRSVRN
jgi:Mn-dependent DtxR family transcriptional regulator